MHNARLQTKPYMLDGGGGTHVTSLGVGAGTSVSSDDHQMSIAWGLVPVSPVMTTRCHKHGGWYLYLQWSVMTTRCQYHGGLVFVSPVISDDHQISLAGVGGGGLYSEVQCIMDNGHMGTPKVQWITGVFVLMFGGTKDYLKYAADQSYIGLWSSANWGTFLNYSLARIIVSRSISVSPWPGKPSWSDDVIVEDAAFSTSVPCSPWCWWDVTASGAICG